MVVQVAETRRGVIAFDLDGTVFKTRMEHDITPRVRAAFQAAYEQGYALAVSTGRAYRELEPELVDSPWLDWCITSNGAAVVSAKSGEPVLERTLAHDVVAEAIRLMGDLPDRRWAHAEDGFYHEEPLIMPDGRVWAPPAAHLVDSILDAPIAQKHGYYKVMAYFDDDEVRAEAQERLTPLADKLEIANEGAGSIEMTAKSVSKGTAGVEICRMLGCAPEASFSFGDSGNDISFAQTPFTFVVMESAEQYVRDTADAICPDVFHDGVAQWLEEHVLA